VDNLRLKVAVVLHLTTCSGKLFQAFTLRHTNELDIYTLVLYNNTTNQSTINTDGDDRRKNKRKRKKGTRCMVHGAWCMVRDRD